MAETIYNSQFNGDSKLRDYNIFEEEYFTSSDIKLTANGVNIKQISMIQYELSEQLKPIYGYASYTYDDIAVGSRIVTGTFVCPVKNLSKNPEFKCADNSNTKNTYSSTDNDSLLKSQGFKKYTKTFANADLYLSPNFNNIIDTINKEEVTVYGEGSNYYYVYYMSGNKYGYIRK